MRQRTCFNHLRCFILFSMLSIMLRCCALFPLACENCCYWVIPLHIFLVWHCGTKVKKTILETPLLGFLKNFEQDCMKRKRSVISMHLYNKCSEILLLLSFVICASQIHSCEPHRTSKEQQQLWKLIRQDMCSASYISGFTSADFMSSF